MQILEDTDMTGIVTTAHVKDAATWEKKFQTHADLFKRNRISAVHYTITGNNDIVMYSEADNIAAYRNFVQSPDVVRAMEEDGVDRNTLKFYELEKDLVPS
jgi:hypothetical protein